MSHAAQSAIHVLATFDPAPLASYVRFYLAISSQLERVWQSVVAIESALKRELGPFAEDLAPVQHAALATLVDAPRVLPKELAEVWKPTDDAGLSGINDVYEVAGRFSFQGERDENLARVAMLVTIARAATKENQTALDELRSLPEAAKATVLTLTQKEKDRAQAAREAGTTRFDPLSDTVNARAKQTVDALAAVTIPSFDDPKTAAEDWKKLRARLQQVYQTCLPFLQGAIAQLWSLVEGSPPQAFPAELPLVPELPTELLSITPIGSEEVDTAERTLARLADEDQSIARAVVTLTEELAKVKVALEGLEARRAENATDLELGVMLHDWARTFEALTHQTQRISESDKELAARVSRADALGQDVAKIRGTLEAQEAAAAEKRASCVAAGAALTELEKKEPLLFGKEEWRAKVSDTKAAVGNQLNELEGIEKSLHQRRAELNASMVRAETARTEQSIADRSLSDARTRRSEIGRALDGLAEKLGTRRPTRPVPPAETEELVLTLEKQRAALESESQRFKEIEKRHAEDGARALARRKQIEVERQHTQARVAGAKIARAEGLDAAERSLAAERKIAVEDHVREILGALSKSLGQVGTVFIEPARSLLRKATEPDFSEAQRVESAAAAAAPVLERVFAERGPELAAVAELCEKIQREFCDAAKDACVKAWG